MKQELVNMLNNVVLGAIRRVIEELESGDPERIDHVRREMENLCYIRDQEPSPEDYSDTVFCDLYLTRFGYAYAFEYSVIYDAIIRSYSAIEQARNGSPVLGVSTLACGTMIDAWGLAYALACIKENDIQELQDDIELSYHGEDRTRWSFLFAGNQDGDQTLNSCFNRVPSTRDLNIGADEFLKRVEDGEYKNYHWLNVMCFAKFLGELRENVICSIEAAIREAIEHGCFVGDAVNNRKEYYICISHSASTVNNNGDDRHLSEVASRIINALNVNNDFDVDPHVMGISPYNNRQDRYGNDVGLVCTDEDIPMYGFAETIPFQNITLGAKIRDLNPDFGNEEADRLLDRLLDLFERNDIDARKPISRANYFKFQVIKLTRRQENN